MASLTRWTWVWVNSRSWWWTGRPGVLQSMGSQRVRHDWATNWTIRVWESRSVVSDSLWPHGLYSPWNSPGQNTEVGSFSLLQRIFPTQGWNPGLLHCRQILNQLSHKVSPVRVGETCFWPCALVSPSVAGTYGVLRGQVHCVCVEVLEKGTVHSIGELVYLYHLLHVLIPVRLEHGSKVLTPETEQQNSPA